LDRFKRPENLTNVMVFVDHVGRIFEIGLCDICVGTPHVADKVFCLGTVKLAEISCKLMAVTGL
jgi:hypothetical protein